MRKLFLFMMISLDGFFEGLHHSLDWHHVDQEFNEFAITQLHEIDTIVFGRKTYELMVSYWPTENAKKDDPIVADLMNKTSKIVFSKTLTEVHWEHTRLVKDNLINELTRLKEQPGKSIVVFGSSNLCITLLNAKLLDELRIMVNPVVLGLGTTLFKGLKTPVPLSLIQTNTFKSGNVLLFYQPSA